jgi:hypothetical protein
MTSSSCRKARVPVDRSVAAVVAIAIAMTLAIPAVAVAGGHARVAHADLSRVRSIQIPSSGAVIASTTLRPLGRTSAAGSPAAPIIKCSRYTGQYPHYSSGDVSWHATWSCSEYADASGSLTLYEDNFPVAYSYPKQYGLKGDMNVRSACGPTPSYYYYYGLAVVTFSAPGYTTATIEGGSPTLKVACG